MRAKLSMSQLARIVPPNQRIMSRYMNLTPLFQWGIKMLKLIDNDALREDEKEKLLFLPQYRNFINDTYNIICVLNKIQQIMKNKGFNRDNVQEALLLLEDLTGDNALKIKVLIAEYFSNTLLKMPNDESIYCSSDIMESCFGKYKEIVKTNKTVGISDLCLCIAALLGTHSATDTKKAMESVQMKQVNKWKKQNIGETLFAEKMNFLKKAG